MTEMRKSMTVKAFLKVNSWICRDLLCKSKKGYFLLKVNNMFVYCCTIKKDVCFGFVLQYSVNLTFE